MGSRVLGATSAQGVHMNNVLVSYGTDKGPCTSFPTEIRLALGMTEVLADSDPSLQKWPFNVTSLCLIESSGILLSSLLASPSPCCLHCFRSDFSLLTFLLMQQLCWADDKDWELTDESQLVLPTWLKAAFSLYKQHAWGCCSSLLYPTHECLDLHVTLCSAL